MKTQILIIQAALVIGMAVLGLGCAKKGSSGFAADNGGTSGGTTGLSGSTTGSDRDTDIERGAEWQAGSIATLVPDYNGWTYYAATHPLNAPQDLKISVSVADNAGHGFSGKVMVSYFDNGQYYTGRFLTGSGAASQGTTHGHDGQYFSDYNRWFVWNGGKGNPRVSGVPTNVFHGFYQDQFGAIMLIIDGSDSNGDGQSSSLKGEVWVRNNPVSQVYENGNNVPCWFIELGPYDCRTLLTSKENLTTTSALYPDQSLSAGGGWYPSYNQTSPARGWKLLGRFEGLDKAKAGL